MIYWRAGYVTAVRLIRTVRYQSRKKIFCRLKHISHHHANCHPGDYMITKLYRSNIRPVFKKFGPTAQLLWNLEPKSKQASPPPAIFLYCHFETPPMNRCIVECNWITHVSRRRHLSYCISCWGWVSSNKLSPLFPLQIRCVRLLFGKILAFDHAAFYETCARTRTYADHMAKKNY